ncbi:uncharacterized protein Z519_07346 [Cladophialophora bantiana CBS 173.52]|uniref:Uncharacterized protein n=1 Tax=Cladophialophora bantiana (strain ATCC 10958 / CBS 173.52 / CDC B-1940 / NIH 8579) TaxID=1442370 RepID=A0A0D2G0U5_CLAB1|nr:uncharacterized protein Z519_07346 [Cladophialophora bantiana CBS 173.52]KIW92362.1 hypothetical protein Z519_07346 [Cladophialophora bantiana CBS 173.52]
MSKTLFDIDPSDRIPTYEESIALSAQVPAVQDSRQRPAPVSSTSLIRQERTRRIYELVRESLIPCFATHVSNLCNHLTVVVVPADVLRSARTLTEQNIVSPSFPSHQTTGVVVTLSGTENHSSFWTQQAVVEELDHLLRGELSNPSAPADEPRDKRRDEKSQPQSELQPQFPVQPAPETQLPARSTKSSWFKRAFSLPGPDHDPTGETGKWNLGWRGPEFPDSGSGHGNSTANRRGENRKLQTDEVAVYARLQDVSFRTESEMGLLESTTIKCIWIDIEVGL